MSTIRGRLASCWYGPVAGVFAVAFILGAPIVHDCFGISAVRGGRGGVVCGWSTPEAGSQPIAVFAVAVAVVLVFALQLILSAPRIQVVVGLTTTLLWLTVVFVLMPKYEIGYWASTRGFEYTNQLGSETLVLLVPASLLPVAAAIWRGGRSGALR